MREYVFGVTIKYKKIKIRNKEKAFLKLFYYMNKGQTIILTGVRIIINNKNCRGGDA